MFVTRAQYNLIHAQRAYTESGDGQTESVREKKREKKSPGDENGI